MIRRLPIYLLIDTSGSMAGEPIEQVKNGMQMLVSALRKEPQALETAYLGVVAFDSSARELQPLTELTAFQSPNLQASGGTSLGAGLTCVAESAKRDVQKSTPEQKGDWRPMVFLLTDGQPTDDWQRGLARFKQEKWGTVVACAVDSADESVLKQITDKVVKLDTANADSIKEFFKWVTASVSTAAVTVRSGKTDAPGLSELPPPPGVIQVVI